MDPNEEHVGSIKGAGCVSSSLTLVTPIFSVFPETQADVCWQGLPDNDKGLNCLILTPAAHCVCLPSLATIYGFCRAEIERL